MSASSIVVALVISVVAALTMGRVLVPFRRAGKVQDWLFVVASISTAAVTFIAARSFLTPSKSRLDVSTITTNIGGLPISIGNPVSVEDAGGAPAYKRVVVGAIQPVTSAGPDGGGSMLLRGLELVAPPGQQAVIGGLPWGAPPGVVPATIVIDDCILDNAIEIDKRFVTVMDNVIRKSYTAMVATTVAPEANDGTDPSRPILPAEDEAFVDRRGGQGWGDKCFASIKAKRWGWAKAECDRGMKMNPAAPYPLAPLLFNEGLIAERLREKEKARAYFNKSIEIRPPEDEGGIGQVRRALSRLDGGL